jgi:hypothetical protein
VPWEALKAVYAKERLITTWLNGYHVTRDHHAYEYVFFHAVVHYDSVLQILKGVHTNIHGVDVQVDVLVASDVSGSQDVTPAYSKFKWCVDSGANRNICCDASLCYGEMKKKVITIGEAGRGHSFQSQGEGAIRITNNDVVSPILDRTIFASQVHENILSVSEAIKKALCLFSTTMECTSINQPIFMQPASYFCLG